MRSVAALLAVCCIAAAAGASERPLRVGVSRAWPPHQFLDAKGHPSGFDVDLFRAVAAVEGLRYEFVVDDWPALRAQLEAGEIDVVPGVFETAAREPRMDFSVPTVWVHKTLFVRKDSQIRNREDLLAGARVLIREAGPHDDDAANVPGTIELLRGVTAEELLRRLAAGEADAAVTLDTLGLWAIRERRLTNLRSVGQPIDVRKLRFAVPEGRDALLAQLNDGLAEVRHDGSYDRIWDRWFGVLEPKGVPLWRVLGALALSFALLVLALLWSVSLRTEVARQGAVLEAAAEERRTLASRLAAGEKMESLGRMAAGIAHDFRNVLTVISANVELSRAEPGLPTRAREALDDAGQAVIGAAALVQQLMSFASRSPLAPVRTSWGAIAHACEALLRMQLPPEIALRFAFDADAGEIDADPSQGQQVVMNLVLNARDALTERTGVIEASARRVEHDGRAWSELAVRDDGAGLDDVTRAHVFEPFYSTKGPGRGIGLATVRAIAERHGGVVEVESVPGAGAVFRVRLPLASTPAANPCP